MAQTFKMNPQEIKRLGTELDGIATNFDNEIKKMIESNATLKNAWKGAAAESYFKKWEEKKNSIISMQKMLKNYADATIKTAEDVIKTDNSISGMMR